MLYNSDADKSKFSHCLVSAFKSVLLSCLCLVPEGPTETIVLSLITVVLRQLSQNYIHITVFALKLHFKILFPKVHAYVLHSTCILYTCILVFCWDLKDNSGQSAFIKLLFCLCLWELSLSCLCLSQNSGQIIFCLCLVVGQETPFVSTTVKAWQNMYEKL